MWSKLFSKFYAILACNNKYVEIWGKIDDEMLVCHTKDNPIVITRNNTYRNLKGQHEMKLKLIISRKHLTF